MPSGIRLYFIGDHLSVSPNLRRVSTPFWGTAGFPSLGNPVLDFPKTEIGSTRIRVQFVIDCGQRIRSMKRLPTIQSCTVCRGPNFGSSAVCPACEEAFRLANADPHNTEVIDLSRYTTKMFPWEPSGLTPRLLSGRWLWSVFCFGLIFLVVLLALLRTPLPTCWETSM